MDLWTPVSQDPDRFNILGIMHAARQTTALMFARNIAFFAPRPEYEYDYRVVHQVAETVG